jgi:hypothetical protein
MSTEEVTTKTTHNLGVRLLDGTVLMGERGSNATYVVLPGSTMSTRLGNLDGEIDQPEQLLNTLRQRVGKLRESLVEQGVPFDPTFKMTIVRQRVLTITSPIEDFNIEAPLAPLNLTDFA